MRKLFVISVLVGFLIIPAVYALEPVAIIGVIVAFAAAAAAGFGGKKAWDTYHDNYRYDHYFDDYKDTDKVDWDKDPDDKLEALKRRRRTLENASEIRSDIESDESLTQNERDILFREASLNEQTGEEEGAILEEDSTILSVSLRKAQLVKLLIHEIGPEEKRGTLKMITDMIHHINQDVIVQLNKLHIDISATEEIEKSLESAIGLVLEGKGLSKKKKSIREKIEAEISGTDLKALFGVWEEKGNRDFKRELMSEVVDETSLEKAAKVAAKHLAELKLLNRILTEEQELLKFIGEHVDEPSEIKEPAHKLRLLVLQEIRKDNEALRLITRDFKVDVQLARGTEKQEVHYLIDERRLDEEGKSEAFGIINKLRTIAA
jgi:hypothetical protein